MAMTDLTALLEKVRSATGPVSYVTAAGWANDLSPWPTESREWFLFVKACGGDLNAIGAALALAERVLPKASIGLIQHREGWSESDVWQNGRIVKKNISPWQRANTPPLAILAALLTALIEKQADG